MNLFKNKTKRTPFCITGFVIFSAMILALGYLYYGYAVKNHKVQIDQELSAIADLKVDQIVHWRKERLADANFLYKNIAFAELVKRYFQHPNDQDAVRKIHNWLDLIYKSQSYNGVFLLDTLYTKKIILPEDLERSSSFVSEKSSRMLHSDKKVVFEDFYWNETKQHTFLKILVPILDEYDNSKVIGIVEMRIDPSEYLYPLLNTWPTPSETSETLILRREGDEVVFLNSLKFKKDLALNLRMPMNGKLAIPAIRAALGEEGIVEALDYRGVPVIAAIRTIHGSPWFMVTRMDQAEAYAPLKERIWILTFFVGLLLIGTGAGFGFMRKQQSARFYRERLEALKKLSESEDKFRLLFDTIPDAIFIHDLEGRFIQVNSIACERLGYSNEELLKMTVKEIDTPKFAAGLDERMAQFLKIGYAVLEVEHKCKDGAIIPTELSSRVIEYAGNPVVLSVARDMTERKKVEAEIQKAQNRLIEAQAVARLGSWEWDIVKDIINGSEEFYHLFDMSPEELLNFEQFAKRLHPDDLGRVNSDVADAIKLNRSYNTDYRVKLGDGKWRAINARGKVLTDETGKPTFMFGTCLDITERKHAEEELQKSEENVRLLLDSTAEAIYGIDLEGNCTFCNTSCLRILGFEHSDQLLGHNMHDLIHHSLIGGTHFPVEDCSIYLAFKMGTGTHRNNEVFWRADGTSFPVEYWSHPVFRNGTIEGAVVTFLDITERKQADEQLILQSVALKAAANAIVITNISGTIEWVNPAFTKLTGYTFEEVTGENPRTIKSGKHDAAFYKNLWDTVLAGNIWHGEMINKRKDDIEYTEEMTITPLKDANGEIIRFIAIKQDITERKWIEETQTFLIKCGYSESDGNVFESLAQYLAKTLDMDYVCIDKLQDDLLTAQTVAVYYDGKFEDNIEYTLKGTPCGEVVENTTCNFPHNTHQLFPDHKLIQEMLAESYIGTTLFSNTGQPIGLIAAIGRKPLKNRYLAESILKLVAIRAAGELERKFAEEEIKRLQQQIDYIFGATKTGLSIVDSDFVLQHVNPALQKIYGGFTGKKCYQYFKGFDKMCDECLVPQAFETQKSVIYETNYPLEDDRVVQATVIPFQESNGIWYAAEVTVDISERKVFEKEIQEAKLEAERANFAKSEFLSRMSHELRTPMNSILGFAQLMNMGELIPAHKKGVDHILKSGKHLLDLINEVLELSRIEAGKLSLSFEPVQLSNIISESLDVIRPLAAGRNVTLEFTKNPVGDFFVEADRQKLKQVLLNLMSNAVKYNREGGSVTIKCSKLQVPNSRLNDAESKLESLNLKPETIRISISDTGKGIAPEYMARLFNPFERVGAEVSEVEGTGLGLTTAKKLIEAMSGTIGVESEPGVGSTFWIELPQAEGQIDRHERKGDFIKSETESVVSGTLLYIEDNVSNIQLVEQILEMHRPQIRLITEMYGKRTVQLATDYQPDLILLDLDLPDIHGAKVLKLLQAKSKTAAIPVVILSADAMSHSIEQLMKAGAKNYLTKPLDVIEFLSVVDEIMKR